MLWHTNQHKRPMGMKWIEGDRSVRWGVWRCWYAVILCRFGWSHSSSRGCLHTCCWWNSRPPQPQTSQRASAGPTMRYTSCWAIWGKKKKMHTFLDPSSFTSIIMQKCEGLSATAGVYLTVFLSAGDEPTWCSGAEPHPLQCSGKFFGGNVRQQPHPPPLPRHTRQPNRLQGMQQHQWETGVSHHDSWYSLFPCACLAEYLYGLIIHYVLEGLWC